MKNLLKTIAVAIVCITCYNCAVDSSELIQEESQFLTTESNSFETPEVLCVNENPQAVLTNSSLESVDFEIFDQFGILMTHAYGVPVGEDSAVLTFPDGMTTFVISASDSVKEVNIDMENCMIYEVEINENNQLDTDVPTPL